MLKKKIRKEDKDKLMIDEKVSTSKKFFTSENKVIQKPRKKKEKNKKTKPERFELKKIKDSEKQEKKKYNKDFFVNNTLIIKIIKEMFS